MKYLFNKLFAESSLQSMIIVPFLAQIIAAVISVGYLSYRSGQESIEEMTNYLMEEISDRIEEHLDNYLQNAQHINQINLNAIENGLIDIENFEDIGKYFWQQIQLYDFTYVNYGNQDNEFIGVGYVDGNLEIAEVSKPNIGTLYSYQPDEQGNRIYPPTILEDENPNDASWYSEAIKEDKLIWSSIYNWADIPDEIAISASAPVYNQSGEVLGVVGVDLSLSKISDFLRTLKIGNTGKTFIIERSGLLVANSTNQKPYQIINGEAKRLEAIQIEDASIQATAKKLIEYFDNFKDIRQNTRLTFNMANQKQFIQVIPYQDNYGIDWLIVVLIPESDFISEINSNLRQTMLLCGFTLVFTTGIGLLTARWIVKPISKLNEASEQITKGNFPESLSENHTISELNTLCRSFNVMSEQINHSFQQVEIALQESKEKYKILFETLPIAIIITDAEGKMIESNPSAEKLFGISSQQLHKHTQGESQFELTRPDGTPLPFSEYTCVRALRDNRLIRDVEIGFIRKNGDREETGQSPDFLWLSESAIPIPLKDYGVIVVCIDITDRKKVEIDLAKAKKTAEIATKAKSQFLANMSHEIRTPMNGVLGMAELLSNTNLNEQQQDLVQTILDSGDVLLTVINDILDFSKIESGMLNLDTHPFILKDVLKSVIKLLNKQALNKKTNLFYSIDSDVPQSFLGDSSRIRQILLNLIGNAVKFTENGDIKVSVEGKLISEFDNKYKLKIRIRDTGIGIKSDQLNKLFKPFSQADASVNRRYGGTGLGLAISKSLVNLMEGNIWAESGGYIAGKPPQEWVLKPENISVKGSSFYISIILKVIFDHQNTSTTYNTKLNQEKILKKSTLKILLAEDNKINQKVALLSLQKLGYVADVANNGLEALEMFEKNSYDVIFMDMQMPEMDGLTATRSIRQLPKPQPWIIALTANALNEDKQLCLDAGMNDYISKPIKIQQLKKILMLKN